MAESKRRFTNFFYILVTLCLAVLVAKVQSSEDVNRVKRRLVAMCPPTFQKIRTECYHISPYPLTWLEAHFECKSKNGKLAEPTRIQDAAIRKFLLNKYASERDEIYFGGMYDHHAKVWSWGVSGQKFNYTSFIGLKTYLKRKTLDHTCTVYNPNRKFRWTPRDCTEQHRFMCEHKMPKVSDKNREKIYQKWNVTYPKQFANEVVMEVREDDKHSNSRRVKVVSESGEEAFYLKRTPHPHRDGNQPLMKRPTYNTPTPLTKHPNDVRSSYSTPAPLAKHPNDVLNDGGNAVDDNVILKSTKNPKKARSRTPFDKEVAKLRRLEKSKQRAAKREERQRRLREKEELRKQKEQENQSKNLEIQREREENERKRLHEERIREEKERQRLEEKARQEEEQRQKLEDTIRREKEERQQLEDGRRLQDDSKRQKRLEMGLVGVDFVPEVITESYEAIEQKKRKMQEELDVLDREIREKYQREQEQELALQKMEHEKHIKELEEKELARRAEEQKHREERERERQELIRQAEETARMIELEKKEEEDRRREEEENRQRLEKEKAERIEQERKEKVQREKERREREEEENRRRAQIKPEMDAEKEKEIDEALRKEDERLRKEEIKRRLSKLTPEQIKKFKELKRQKKLKQSRTANEVTGDDKK